MKYIVSSIFVSLLFLACGSSKTATVKLATNSPINTYIDLTKVKDDKVPVVINPERFNVQEVIYRLPKVVQGSYDVSDFGSFIDDFKAFDYEGNEMDVSKKDTNSWVIANATALDKITYWVNDSYDVENNPDYPKLFSPQGTNIQPNNYVLNLHGFIGYFDSLKNAQYTIDITAPANFKRSSALENTAIKSSPDGTKITTSYFAPRYFDVTDNPMMYGDLSVEEFMVGDIKIVLSVFSPNKVHTAASLKETIYTMMQAQKAYLKDINSTKRYDIYLYLSDENEGSPTGFGALEHHTATTVVLRESSSKERLAKSMTDIVAHEFFHILTPLSVHSEDVHYFDYNDPTFSKHLWMYEGLTEYFAQHFQVQQGLITPEEYYKVILREIILSGRYDDAMSFTEMSENVLKEPYATNYNNVYQKGALIGMCMDILLREESNGQRSMLSLMKELSNKYGKNRPFNDDTIIEEIVKMTYPSIGNFLNTYVVGNTPIDYNTFFNKAGLELVEEKTETNYIRGGYGYVVKGDEAEEKLLFSDGIKRNTFWSSQDVKENDWIKEVNGIKVTMFNAQTILGQMYQWKPGQEIEVKLDRAGAEIIINTTLTTAYTLFENLVEKNNASKKEVELRDAWLKG
ncbi:M61 family metallopeptidase [Ichthyenterobacterium magnum]|uniref:Putative metalloprotease with PDZ domain n=1 Tax=Ichthyenterobacterium magnum TaxID=1230530 RepID=A0A420DM26_9FLAO|nr:peptidase M61 [Ichthyenterobacterium magnum]RKE95260.1 putative metalloprotease with PDZ domain [Ichthyenterobacterium magnum]